MAKNLDSISFTVLLLVLSMASTDIMKSEATCIFLNGRTMTAPCLDTNCRAFCDNLYGSNNLCAAPCEAVGKKVNCHCYGYIRGEV
ncbi:unnamed protein product [Eruca vesicaria subsp. sativa]|uniref:Uncharacterized protein n=1 Tax=Eruca vesicaria subsp. sativa TaxID=29727 RepID=A0ABC8LWE4_ERUVS|nr:unnamed protein product [Eruca vesicaria subsp. sativa]